MSLGENFDKRLKNSFGCGAVFPPGDAVSLGDIMVRRDGLFHPIGKLGDFGVSFTQRPHVGRSLDLKATGTKERVFQAGLEIKKPDGLDLEAQAEVKYEFSSDYGYVLKTPQLDGEHISNMLQVGQTVAGADGWLFDRYYVVEKLYTANAFSFIGNQKKTSGFTLNGKGSAIFSFLTAGLGAGLSTSGNIDMKIIGQSGPVSMGLVRIRKDGRTRH
jgi:hypothetical protein